MRLPETQSGLLDQIIGESMSCILRSNRRVDKNRISGPRRWLVGIAALGFGLSTASIAQPAKWLHMQPNVIVDHTGFGKPTPAITLFTPVGWKASGGVVWGEQFACTKYFAFNWKVTTPDELTGAALLPQQGWEFNSAGTNAQNLGCGIAQANLP